MKVIYVAGPIRDARGNYYVEQNVRRAEAVSVELWRRGFVPICPHTMTRNMEGVIPCDEFVERDLLILERCDAVVVCEGWQCSVGTVREIEHAWSKGIRVFGSVRALLSACRRDDTA